MKIQTVGSVCSGIEAASVAWKPLGFEFKWFSEIADFPSRLLKEKYPTIPNLGDMSDIPLQMRNEVIEVPDLICGGTPCQAFSLAGGKHGLKDDRGNLTLKFVDLIEANDEVRKKKGLSSTILFWENVEGVLTDKTNAFGCFISALAGLDDIMNLKKWPKAGILRGPKRNIAWRVLDAKYFGVPQQRKRLYLLAGGKEFYPENILFEKHIGDFPDYPQSNLTFYKDGHQFEVFRDYTDCLYASYGTKWNGNAAAYNGSLFVAQDGRIRRLSPLETERLMGFPDHYTDIMGAKRTHRYQATGNSWAVPVVEWIGKRIIAYQVDELQLDFDDLTHQKKVFDEGWFIDLGKGLIDLGDDFTLNCTAIPESCVFTSLKDVVSPDAPEEIYLSPVGCQGILRRKQERKLNINPRLERFLLNTASQMTPEEIETRSRIQKRGCFSKK